MYRRNVVMVTLTTGMFLLFTCMHIWVWRILRRWFVCAPTAYEVVRDCRKFEKHLFREALSYINSSSSLAYSSYSSTTAFFKTIVH
jgi:hypothetical protein